MSLGNDGRLAHPSPRGALRPDLPVWGLFWRSVLAAIGFVLIIPSPWTTTALYRFICDDVALPDGKRLKFAGQPADIWYVFMGVSAVSWLHGIIDHHHLPRYLGLVVALATWALTMLVFKWFCAHLKSEDDRLSLSFEGGYWPYAGWNILLLVSFVTIVGWAWVLKFMMQWVCRNVRGTASFDFTATGWDILWRTIVLALVSMLVIPIPWMGRWYTNWMISQISVVQPGAATAAT